MRMGNAIPKKKKIKKIDARKILRYVLNAERQIQEETLLQATAIYFYKNKNLPAK